MKKKEVSVERKTKEVDVNVKICLNGNGISKIDIPLPFLSHMLELLSFHSKIDMEIKARGDIDVDPHHTVEDVGIALGEAFSKAIRQEEGIARFGSATVPMDESLVTASLDISGRGFLKYNVDKKGKIGNFDMELIETFLQGFAAKAGITIHVILHYGRNKHHIVEGIFKALAVALRNALYPLRKGVSSTKGVL